MGDYTFLSIDEVAVSLGRIDTETACRNIQRLQQHIFHDNLYGAAMASNGPQFTDRQRSVTDEEMFGDGSQNFGNDSETNKNISDNVIDELIGNKGNEGIGVSAVLPNFLMFEPGSSSGSYSENQPTSNHGCGNGEQIDNYEHTGTDADVVRRRNMLSEQPDPKSSDFRMQYISKRSISDIHEKRTAFRNSCGGEVFEEMTPEQVEDQIMGKHLRKSNSLPGNACSSSSSLSPHYVHSDPSDRTDVTNGAHMTEKLSIKLSLEGPSVKPALKTNASEKPKLNRHVSFQDDEGHGTIPGRQNADQTKSSKSCMTPTEERRFTYQSSGYGTGSSAGSQDTNDARRKNSQISEGSSNVWTSQESEKENRINNVLSEEGYESIGASFEINGGGTIKETDESCDSSVSQITVRRAQDDDVEKSLIDTHKQISQEVNSKSINENSKSLPTKQNLSDENEQSPGVFMRLKSQDEKAAESRKDQPSKNKDLTGRLRKSCDPSSFGNLPHFSTLDESFQVKSSSIAKVFHEEDKNRHAVIAKHCANELQSTSMCSQLPMAKVSSGRKSLSQQQSPREDVKKFEEILGQEDFSPHQILEILDNHSSSTSPSPTPNTVEKYRRVCTLNSKDFSADDLVQASRCNNVHCNEIICIKLQEVMHTLGSDFPLSDEYELRRQYFQALCSHNCECEEVKCPVRFCQEITEWQKEHSDQFTVEDMGRTIQKHVTSPCMNIVLDNKCTLLKLQSSEKKPEIVNFETYIPLFPTGKFGNAVVCKEMATDSLVVVTKYPMMDYKHQLSLYSRIVDLKHPHIVRQLWLLEYGEKIQVCTVFAKGGNLKDYLTSVGQLPWQLAVVYMRQLLSAISHLHSHKYGVIYLYWCSENFMFTNSGRRVLQLGNFRLACPRGCKLDYGSLKTCLPYSICPPELITDNVVDFQSDCWGAGCVLYEMLTGSQYLNELRHENQSKVHNKVIQGTRPDLSSFRTELRAILDSCWQIPKERRMPVVEILKRFNTISLSVS